MDLSNEINIIVIDDERIMREGLRALFTEQHDIQIVAETETLIQAVNAIDAGLSADVAILNISAITTNIIGSFSKLLKRLPLLKIIVLSPFSNKAFVSEVIQAGAHGYVLRRESFSTLLESIKTVVCNSIYLCNSVRYAIAEQLASYPVKFNNNLQNNIVLNDREYKILQLLAEGQTSKQIAWALSLSSKTIDAARRELMQKLNVDSLAGLIKYAILTGITSLSLPHIEQQQYPELQLI